MTLSGKDPRLVSRGGNNYGMALDLVDDLIVPSELFFVRSNGSVPEIDPATWTLKVDGRVRSPLTLTLADLRSLPTRSYAAFLECAGNSRTRFSPEAEGTRWLEDAAGTAVWEGTPLRGVLELAGLDDGVVDILAIGGDEPPMQRALPLANALDPDVLLVWSMNGAPLTTPHGGPVRLLVPRWGGIASTKWLTTLTALDHPFTGFYNAVNYVMISPEGEHLTPVREMPVKSVIAAPAAGSILTAGEHTIHGFAWSGYGDIATVHVSTDDGATWQEARITRRAGPLAWVRWEHTWQAGPGTAVIQAKATDSRTLTQPRVPAWNAKGYQMNGIHSVPVTVR